MLIARRNFIFFREFQPTVSFTITHLHGKEIEEASLKIKNLKCFEIEYKATGHTALEILNSGKELSKVLEVIDMHVSYKRGVIIFHILTTQKPEKVEEFVRQRGKFHYANSSVKRKRKSISRWIANKEQINQEYKASERVRRFITNLSQNQEKFQELELN